MSVSTEYTQEYQQAVSAYMQGHYQDAASATDKLVNDYPDDPNLRLLRGHIYSCLSEYEIAREQYQTVLSLTNDPELLDCARNSLEDSDSGSSDAGGSHTGQSQPFGDDSQVPGFNGMHFQGSVATEEHHRDPVDSIDPMEQDELEAPFINPFETDANTVEFNGMSMDNSPRFEEVAPLYPDGAAEFDAEEDDTLLMSKRNGKPPVEQHSPEGSTFELSSAEDNHDSFEPNPLSVDSQDLNNAADFSGQHEEYLSDLSGQELGDRESMQDFEESYNGILPEEAESVPANANTLEDMDGLALDQDILSNELLSVPGGEIAENGVREVMDGDLFDFVSDESATSLEQDGDLSFPEESSTKIGAPPISDPTVLQTESSPSPARSRLGLLAPFENASLQQKQVITAAAAGVVSALAVVAAGQATAIPQKVSWGPVGLGALAAGLAGGATTLALGQILAKQIKTSTSDLQAKLTAVAQGDWTVKATELSRDEFGQLANSFNQMTQFIEVTTKEAQDKAAEQEKAKEDLQRQVIRLLDDVEGAARGDLTVQAEVTADILGAVADSFNLTIHNLQKIVKQVKGAAREVNKAATNNEEFARALSSDALKQAEELAATLNSVQMMTQSIKQVADSARAADQVAQQASEAAYRGGESVEHTVNGILQIRETVAETTRKVKRLAESSQEISKIVGLISQIASRTNLLALNASIEAARAGESGRGFAVVADEVRQLADRAAKASKEIEQIVLQIQGETSSVMTAMEEGTQQVIEGTNRAEQAKRSLEDIIQVSAKINQLVGSITQATAKQTETSRSVAQVMQAVELTAQETSQESQRVSDSLHHLVGVARDLQSSVERFRVEDTQLQ